MSANRSVVRAYLISIAAWIVVALVSLRIGSVSHADYDLIYQLRLPRVILAGAVGMGLAVAGAVLQALFANPLCEPYTLGISSGATLGTVIGIAIGFDLAFFGIAGSAFLGALLFAAILYFISRRAGVGNLTLLLAGVMLGFVGSSLVALWMAVADANGIHGAIFWLIGDLSRARLAGATASLVIAFMMSSLIWMRWRELDALLLGEEGALALGIEVPRVRQKLLVRVSVLIGLCVSGAGMISFVGLVVPHFVRFWTGSLHRRLIPLSAIWGAVSLTAADALARAVAGQYELPVGVVTALAGAPMFLWIMLRRPGRGSA